MRVKIELKNTMYIDYGYGLENCIKFDVLCTERNTILKTYLNYIYYLYINSLTRFKFFLFRKKKHSWTMFEE